jgi:hypothetical protein
MVAQNNSHVRWRHHGSASGDVGCAHVHTNDSRSISCGGQVNTTRTLRTTGHAHYQMAPICQWHATASQPACRGNSPTWLLRFNVHGCQFKIQRLNCCLCASKHSIASYSSCFTPYFTNRQPMCPLLSNTTQRQWPKTCGATSNTVRIRQHSPISTICNPRNKTAPQNMTNGQLLHHSESYGQRSDTPAGWVALPLTQVQALAVAKGRGGQKGA